MILDLPAAYGMFCAELHEFDHIPDVPGELLSLAMTEFDEGLESAASTVRDTVAEYGGNGGPTQQKSFSFAVDCGKTALMICASPRSFAVGNQLLRCSSSVGANVEEANGAYSPQDFAMKMSISLKEARESRFWIRYCLKLELINTKTFENLHPRADELVRLLAKIISTTNKRYPKTTRKPIK